MKLYFNEFDANELEKAESLLFNGNGFLGVRGNLEEQYYDGFSTNRETYLNGFYDRKTIKYPEKFTGFPEVGETMISVIDCQTAFIDIGGERVNMFTGEVIDHVRYLDMANGKTVREFSWRSSAGATTRIKIERIASFVYKDRFSLKYSFNKVDHDKPITLIHEFNFKGIKSIDLDDPRGSHDTNAINIDNVSIEHRAIDFSAKSSALKARLLWQFSDETESHQLFDDKLVLITPVKSETFEKHLSYEFGDQISSGIVKGFAFLERQQADYLTAFWDSARIDVESDLNIEESVNYGTYSLLQSLGSDGKTSISAKGLSGSGYEGHYFWDAEMYIFPVFLSVAPQLAKSMLDYRVNTLPEARKIRSSMGYKRGASYPWRTISGIECSPFFEAGTAQFHINTDIAYAFIEYYKHTGDVDFFFAGGFEVLLETARFMYDLGYYRDGEFHIDQVTGPDEYTALVDDNYYTNHMTKHHFSWIVQLAGALEKADYSQWQTLQFELAIYVDELERFSQAANVMALPVDTGRGLIKQDRDFLNKEFWPFYQDEKYPLLLHYHPLTIYRYQVCKQADAVLATMLFQDVHERELIENTVNYYDSITTHDSSLSYSIFSTVYARLGNTEKAFKYFLENARCDLDNLHKNTKDGLHTAAMGGTYINLIYGFCNLKKHGGVSVSPNLPKEIRAIRFKTQYQGNDYEVKIDHNGFSVCQCHPLPSEIM